MYDCLLKKGGAGDSVVAEHSSVARFPPSTVGPPGTEVTLRKLAQYCPGATGQIIRRDTKLLSGQVSCSLNS